MPAKYDMNPTPVFAGTVCDGCGMEDNDGCNDFVLKHTFGYGSNIDGESVEAAVCDKCLENIIRNNLPSAIWTGP